LKLTLFVECVAGRVLFRLADLAADAEHHAIVRQRRIVQTLLATTQRIGPAAQINQVTPVRIVARQA